MKLALKNIYISVRKSKASTAFDASLYINGHRVGFARNEGQGEKTYYDQYSIEGGKLIAQAEQWCRTHLPSAADAPGPSADGNSDLATHIDHIVQLYRDKQEGTRLLKRFADQLEHSILFGTPQTGYRALQLHTKIAHVLKSKGGTDFLRDQILRKIQPVLLPGDRILNTNLPEELLTLADRPHTKKRPAMGRPVKERRR